MDAPLSVDDSASWNYGIESPNIVLHNIVTHNVANIETVAQLEDVQRESKGLRDANLSPRAIKAIKTAKKRNKQVNTGSSLPSRTQPKRNGGS